MQSRDLSGKIHCVKSQSFKTFKTEIRADGAGDTEVREDPGDKEECMRGSLNLD